MSKQYQKQKYKWIEQGKQKAEKDEIKFLKQLKEIRGYSKTYLSKKIDIRLTKLKGEIE